MNTICFATVIFESNLKYFKAFLESLGRQSDKMFTLLIFNDGVSEIESYLQEYVLPYQIVEVSGTIGGIRTNMLDYLKETCYTSVVFGDSDDTFESNRVAINRKLLEEYDIVGNDISLMTATGVIFEEKYWRNRKEIQSMITFESIENYNFLGLGNTAMRLNVLPEDVSFSETLLAIDWMLFSRILLQKRKAIFTSETTTNYRQHSANIVGRKELTAEGVQRIIKVKQVHYQRLAEWLPAIKEKANRYKTLIDGRNEISEERIIDDSLKINAPFWWEEV